MTESYIDLILNFDQLANEKQPQSDGKLYFQKHFDQHACRKLYDQFADGMIENYILKSAVTSGVSLFFLVIQLINT